MGNAESSSWGGGGHGEKEEGKREQQPQDTESDWQKALKLAGVAATTAAVAYGAYNKLKSQTEAEKEKERMADPWMRERADRSSSNPYIREGKGPSTGVYHQAKEEENLQTGMYILEGKAVAVWSPPDEGWVKLNTDFSGPSSLYGPSGRGIIIRDHRAEVLWCSAEQVEDCNITNGAEGEALALLRGLQIARDRRYQKVVAETDHETNVKDINDVGYKGSHGAGLEKAIMEVKRAFSWFEECEIRHIKREGNQCANHLARAAKSGSIPFEKLRDSDNLKKLLEEDEKKSFGTRSCKLGQSSTVSTMNGKLYL